MKQEEERLGKEIDELMRQAEVVEREEDRNLALITTDITYPEDCSGEKIQADKIRSLRDNWKPRKERGNNTSRRVKPDS